MEKCDFSVKFATSKKDKTDTAKDVKLEGDCKVLSARSVREAMGGISDLKMIVLSLGITYLTASSIVLIMSSLALIQIYHASDRLDNDRQEHKEREEFTETPRIHGISTNDIRFMEADKVIQHNISLMWIVFLFAATYTCASISLITGVIRRSYSHFFPWIIAQAMLMCFIFITLLTSIMHVGFFNKYVRDTIAAFPDRSCVLMAWFFFEGISIPIVTKYRHQLKLSKKHKTDDNISVPRRIVSLRKKKTHASNGAYKHHLTDDNPNYVV